MDLSKVEKMVSRGCFRIIFSAVYSRSACLFWVFFPLKSRNMELQATLKACSAPPCSLLLARLTADRPLPRLRHEERVRLRSLLGSQPASCLALSNSLSCSEFSCVQSVMQCSALFQDPVREGSKRWAPAPESRHPATAPLQLHSRAVPLVLKISHLHWFGLCTRCKRETQRVAQDSVIKQYALKILFLVLAVWVFAVALRLSLRSSGDYSLAGVRSLSLQCVLLVQSAGSRPMGSGVVVPGPGAPGLLLLGTWDLPGSGIKPTVSLHC